MTKEQAFAALKATNKLTTGMLEPLGISFENFLKYSQLPAEKRQTIVTKLIQQLEGKAQ